MTTHRSSHTIRAVAVEDEDPVSPQAPLHVVTSTSRWGADVTLAPIEDLSPHVLSIRMPTMTGTEQTLLRTDIATRGIQNPLEITPHGVVLDGCHRLAVARELGITEVPVRTVTPDDEAAHILGAALTRRNLSASQKAALAVECDEYRMACVRGRQRKLANLKPGPDVARLPHRGTRSRELAATIAGVSPRTIQDASTVREADPELFAEVLAGHLAADKAARRIRRLRRYAEITPAPPIPEGPFDLILADPPWQMGAPGTASCPENHYPTMRLVEIEALNIPAAESCVLYLWAVNSLLPEALGVMTAWGFTYRANLCWVKPAIGPGNWARQRHELILVGTRGEVGTPREEDRPDSVIEATRGRHSQKPEGLYERIERAYPQFSKCELFARGVSRAGWVAWGNEVIDQ